MAAGATGVVPLDGVMRALYLANTGAFLLMAGSVHEAFTPARGLLHGPVLFASATTAAGLCALGMWIHVGRADRRWRGNAGLVVALMLTARSVRAALPGAERPIRGERFPSVEVY